MTVREIGGGALSSELISAELSVAWPDVGFRVAGSLLVGLLLWAVLPRGVVLTKRVLVGQPDSWEIENRSAPPVQITSVTACGVGTINAAGEIEERALPPEGCGLTLLGFNDEQLETLRDDTSMPWNRVVVPPGETMTAAVSVNTKLTINYRRCGLFGRFERRMLTITGYG